MHRTGGDDPPVGTPPPSCGSAGGASPATSGGTPHRPVACPAMPAEPASPPTRPPSATEIPDDWPARVTELVTRGVGTARDRITGPALTVARVIAYGALLAVWSTVLATLIAIAVVRLLVEVLPAGSVWAAHLITGGTFLTVGLLLWTRRRRPADA